MAKVKKSVSVNAPVDIVYRAWHNFENFPTFMENIEDVRVTKSGRSHWKARGPLGIGAEWDAEVTVDKPNETIGWRSIEKSNVRTAGRVSFRAENGHTNIDVVIEYEPPAGAAGEVVTKIFANPERQVEEDLTHFKEVIEKGVELSGLNFDHPAAPGLGSSLGAASESALEDIADAHRDEEPHPQSR